MKKKFSSFLDEAGRCWSGYKPVPGKKKHEQGSCVKEETELQEGRPSQRHPLEGHEYHKKSDEALIHIAKDAHAAAEAMKGHNTQAENKYRDQANDSATVRHFRKKSGMPDWYKKKYGHVKEEVDLDEGLQQTLRKVVPGYAKKQINQKMDRAKFGKTDADKDANYYRYKKVSDKLNKEETEQIDEKEISVRNAVGKTLKVAAQFKDTYVKHGYKPVPGTRMEEVEELEEKKNLPGLWANIHAKRARGERPAKPGEKGYPKTLNIEAANAAQQAAIAVNMKKKGIKPKNEEVELDESEAWTRKEGQSESGGLNRKGIAAYRAAHPGSKLSMAVTTKPSKLKPGSKAANRRKSFCARMGGMKRRLTSAKTARDPDSRINKALRKWNC